MLHQSRVVFGVHFEKLLIRVFVVLPCNCLTAELERNGRYVPPAEESKSEWLDLLSMRMRTPAGMSFMPGCDMREGCSRGSLWLACDALMERLVSCTVANCWLGVGREQG
jgi:hypothetical protein